MNPRGPGVYTTQLNNRHEQLTIGYLQVPVVRNWRSRPVPMHIPALVEAREFAARTLVRPSWDWPKGMCEEMERK